MLLKLLLPQGIAMIIPLMLLPACSGDAWIVRDERSDCESGGSPAAVLPDMHVSNNPQYGCKFTK